ncbi:gliding motility-associated C-terminal domain-containing protein, partial [Psychroserpens sp. XS_ASV72]|uniref:T9SS type B sorting domain-containing protein n=1 Tax=Psychroserpens sp. XS_ASV72 TaxID=3241293 RepID=UPI003513EAD5
ATITVDPLPNAVTVSATAPSVCSGDDGEFVVSGDAGDTVTYSIDGGPSVTGVIPADGTLEIAVVGITSATTIDVSNVSNMSCDLDLTGVSATITVDPLPNAGIDGAVEICGNQLTEAQIFSELGGTPDNGGIWVDNLGNLISFPIDQVGVYTYVVIGNGSCATTSDSATVTVTECPDPIIEVIKTAILMDNGDNVVGVGDVINYTITVENIGNVTVNNVQLVSDILTDINNNLLVLDSPVTFDPLNSDNVEGILLVNEVATYQASYTITQNDVDAGGVQNIATFSAEGPNASVVSDQSDDPTDSTNADLDGNGDPDDPTIIFTDSDFDLSVFKEVDVLEPMIGDQVTFTITVANEGFVTAIGVVVEDILPSGYSFVSAIVTVNNGSYSDTTGLWTVGNLNSGQVAILQITVEVLGFGDYVNTAIVEDSSGRTDINLNNNTSSASVDPICLTIYNEFSPNGDGVNETFVIDCIETFANNKVEIYNRWGNIVYEKQGYRNDWDGTSNGRVVVNESNELPEGTYYYVIDLGDGSEPRVGWLYINR